MSALVITADQAELAQQVADDTVQVLKSGAVDESSTPIADPIAGFANPSTDISGIEKLVTAVAVGVSHRLNNPAPLIWTAPTLAGSWHNASSPSCPTRYTQDSLGTVFIEGIVTGTEFDFDPMGPTSLIFTLPAGFRPTHDITFSTPCTTSSALGLVCQIFVLANGQVRLWGALAVISPDDWVSVTLCFKAGP